MSAIAPFTPNPERAKRKRKIVIHDQNLAQMRPRFLHQISNRLPTVVHVRHGLDEKELLAFHVAGRLYVVTLASSQLPPESLAQRIDNKEANIVASLIIL